MQKQSKAKPQSPKQTNQRTNNNTKTIPQKRKKTERKENNKIDGLLCSQCVNGKPPATG